MRSMNAQSSRCRDAPVAGDVTDDDIPQYWIAAFFNFRISRLFGKDRARNMRQPSNWAKWLLLLFSRELLFSLELC
jgi:hypothetical protein